MFDLVRGLLAGFIIGFATCALFLTRVLTNASLIDLIRGMCGN